MSFYIKMPITTQKSCLNTCACTSEEREIRPIYIGKNKNKKNLCFLLYRLQCLENLQLFFFLARKAHARKKTESHTGFWVRGTIDRTCAVRRGPRVIPWKFTSHVTKNLNNTGERGVNNYIGKKQWKKQHTSEVGFSIRGFCSA